MSSRSKQTIIWLTVSVCVAGLQSRAVFAARQPTPSTQPQRRIPPLPKERRTRGSRQELDRWTVPPAQLPEKCRLVSFDSDLAKTFVSYLVYLPPQYEKETKRRFPTIYLLPGIGGDCREVGPLIGKFDEAMRDGTCPALIVIGVQGIAGSFYTDARDGKRPVESVIVKELIERVDNTFRTIRLREYRGIEGMSMGGAGAAHLGFEYPDLFGAVSIFAPLSGPLQFYQGEFPPFATDVWEDDQRFFDAHDPYLLVEKNAQKIRGRTKVRLFVGADDRYRVLAEDLHARLDSLGIAHEWQLVPGARHNLGILLGGVPDRVFPFWKDAFPPYTPPPTTDESN